MIALYSVCFLASAAVFLSLLRRTDRGERVWRWGDYGWAALCLIAVFSSTRAYSLFRAREALSSETETFRAGCFVLHTKLGSEGDGFAQKLPFIEPGPGVRPLAYGEWCNEVRALLLASTLRPDSKLMASFRRTVVAFGDTKIQKQKRALSRV